LEAEQPALLARILARDDRPLLVGRITHDIKAGELIVIAKGDDGRAYLLLPGDVPPADLPVPAVKTFSRQTPEPTVREFNTADLI
jgi:hypothetical protein